MDHPVHQIPGVITALTQGSTEDQEKALNDYFLPDSYFTHPFCRVPSFSGYAIPFTSRTVDSRWLLQKIYQWYRILSPDIHFAVDSVVFDQRASLLYCAIRQTFTLWFVPFGLWRADVRLVTVLELAHLPVGADGRPLAHITLVDNNDDDDDHSLAPHSRYFVKGQEDLYQVNEFLKFVAPFGAAVFWQAWQLFATLLCAFGVLLWPPNIVRASSTKVAARKRI